LVAISWSAGTLALAVVTALLAGVTAGLAGFGFNLLATPIFLLVIPAKMAIALLAVLALLHSAAMWWHLRRRVDVRRLWPLLVGGVGGIPLRCCSRELIPHW
jgi:uncharacterized membrane protein YfcA